MAPKSFKRIGIRRDNNLRDLEDPRLSLNNLLDTLAAGGSSTFISEDLDAIRNIFAYNLSSGGYRQLISSKVEFSTSNGGKEDFLPRITYQNQIGKLKEFSGVPRVSGGN